MIVFQITGENFVLATANVIVKNDIEENLRNLKIIQTFSFQITGSIFVLGAANVLINNNIEAQSISLCSQDMLSKFGTTYDECIAANKTIRKSDLYYKLIICSNDILRYLL